MARFVSTLLIPLAVGVTTLAAPAAALAQAPAGSPSATSPVLAPKAPAPESSEPKQKRNRPVSGSVAAALSAAAPKYTPPPPKVERPSVEELPDLREIDKPKNNIVRLPQYIVQEPKPAVFSERSISTEKGLTDIAVRRYISDLDRALNRFTIPLFGASYQARAMAMYEEDERLRNMADLNDAAVGAAKSDPAAGAYIRREAQQTFMRTSDFGWNGGAPK